MASSVTRYTNRCSCVTRRDQHPASTYFSGSGFPRAFEWVSHDCLNQIEHPDCDATLGLHPKPEVLKELRLKYGGSFSLSLHRVSLFAMRPLFRV